MKPGSLPCSHEHTISPCSEPDYPNPHPISLRTILYEIKLFQPTSHVSLEQQSNVSETISVSIIRE
jgi:hypothetical protein